MSSAFSVLSAATAPGAVTNEDAFGLWPDPQSPVVAWVLDGVTGVNDRSLLPGSSDAAWFVDQVQHLLPELLSAGPDRPIAALIGALVERLELRQSASWLDARGADGRETPAASFAMVRLLGEDIEIARLGDCLVTIERLDGGAKTLAHPVLERMEAETKQAIEDLQSAGVTDPADIRRRLDPMMVKQRRRRNRPEGYGVLAAEPDCLAMLHVDRFPAQAIGRILLSSDGYYRLVDHYSAVTDTGLLRQTAELGVERLLAELRAIEAGDPAGAKYPRLKMSDDATAVLLGVRRT